MKQIKWAIVGTGYIANNFASGMQVVKDAVLAAVVSRNENSGKTFAEKYGCSKVYTDLDKMLKSEDIDIVYVAIPNDCHYSYIMKILDAGVSVLSEKPIVDNRKQLNDILDKAKTKNLFLMEGMWTRCFPAVRQTREWIESGRIGAPRTVRSGFDIKPDADNWQTWKGGIRHAGGALRDVGIYALAMAYMVFPDDPVKVYSNVKLNGEVDESCQMMLLYEDGKSAFVSGAFNQVCTPDTEIVGEKGRIIIGPEFWHPTTSTLILNDGTTEVFEEKYSATGFQYEIQQVQRCLREGKLECQDFTWKETEKIADLIEKTRKEWGIIYESDK